MQIVSSKKQIISPERSQQLYVYTQKKKKTKQNKKNLQQKGHLPTVTVFMVSVWPPIPTGVCEENEERLSVHVGSRGSYLVTVEQDFFALFCFFVEPGSQQASSSLLSPGRPWASMFLSFIHPSVWDLELSLCLLSSVCSVLGSVPVSFWLLHATDSLQALRTVSWL